MIEIYGPGLREFKMYANVPFPCNDKIWAQTNVRLNLMCLNKTLLGLPHSVEEDFIILTSPKGVFNTRYNIKGSALTYILSNVK